MGKMKLIVAFLLVGFITTAAGGAAAWWAMRDKPTASGAAAKKIDDPKLESRYITLEKVVVMLRRKPEESSSHYLAADLVFKTTPENEKMTKEHLPMLRSVTVRALSALPREIAEMMTVDQLAEEIDRELSASYAREQRDKPFSAVMIGKLIIE